MEKITHGILLRKVFLANDDGVLEFFTNDYGKCSLFVPKFARSKKKINEIDFFRLLELEIFEGRNSKRLKTVTTKSLFHGFEKSYELNQLGFLWLEILNKILPEEKESLAFFSQVVSIFGYVESIAIEKIEVFFWVKIFNFLGIFPRFDQIQTDVFFDPMDCQFFSAARPKTLKITNLSRQILEFLRRNDVESLNEKQELFSDENLKEVLSVLLEMKKYHI